VSPKLKDLTLKRIRWDRANIAAVSVQPLPGNHRDVAQYLALKLARALDPPLGRARALADAAERGEAERGEVSKVASSAAGLLARPGAYLRSKTWIEPTAGKSVRCLPARPCNSSVPRKTMRPVRETQSDRQHDETEPAEQQPGTTETRCQTTHQSSKCPRTLLPPLTTFAVPTLGRSGSCASSTASLPAWRTAKADLHDAGAPGV
jgi:hypothetical protein